MIDPPTLYTARLVLRPFRMNDVADLFAIRGDAKAMEFWDWPHDQDVSWTAVASETFIQDMQLERALYWTARTADGEFAGIFDLSELNDDADLGFMVPRPLWGRGYGFEGATALVNEAWRRGLPWLGARIHDGNDRSARLLAKLGFVPVTLAVSLQIRPDATVACRRFRLVRPGMSSSML